MKKGWLVIILLLLVVVGGATVWTLIANAPPPRRQNTAQQQQLPELRGGLQDHAFHTERQVARAESVLPHATPSPTAAPQIVTPEVIVPTSVSAPMLAQKIAPMRIYTSTLTTTTDASPTPAPTPEDLGDYAPFGRLVRCRLVITVDSSNITTPILGKVTDDLVWDGKIIIPECSEVHGKAQLDKSRERIAGEGVFTFVLHDKANIGEGRELVVKGIVLDKQHDPEFKTWGVTDGSAGFRGIVVTRNTLGDEVKLFAATFISGISQGLAATNTTAFGTTVNDPNGRGAGNLPGYVINPTVGGVQAVLDKYAQRISDAIDRDGYFIRVPSGSEFYLYVDQEIYTHKDVGGYALRQRVQQEYLDDRAMLDKVTEPRFQRDARMMQSASTGPANVTVTDPQLQELTRHLESTGKVLEERSRSLQNQSEQLQVQPLPSPTPIP
jgi:type F conjugative transfer system protein TrbI